MNFDEEGKPIPDYENEDTGFSDTIKQLQGDTNAGKLLEVTLNSDEDKPEFVDLSSKTMIKNLR